MKNSDQIFCINSMINANSIEMKDNSKWIVWALNQKKRLNKDFKFINKLAYIITFN
jgi:hypothetical protein